MAGPGWCSQRPCRRPHPPSTDVLFHSSQKYRQAATIETQIDHHRLANHLTHTHTPQPFYGPFSGRDSVHYHLHNTTTHNDRFMAVCPGLPGWAGTRRNTHPPTILIIIQSLSFFHLPRSIASSLFKLRAWQSFCTTSLHVLFGLCLGLEPMCTPYIESQKMVDMATSLRCRASTISAFYQPTTQTSLHNQLPSHYHSHIASYSNLRPKFVAME